MNKKIINCLNSVLILIWVILLAILLRWSILEIYVMPLKGMMPTLFPNDHLIANKLAYGLISPFSSSYILQWAVPQRGEVIVFRSPFDSRSLSIRRVVGVPGDRVFFENGNLYINEQKIIKQIPARKKKDFSWIKDEMFSDEGMTADKSHYIHWEETLSDITYSILLKKKREGYLIFGPYHIPPRYYFVMGDHRDQSQDSRTWPARIQKAAGNVTFSRTNTDAPALLIPKGTLVRTGDLKLPEYFETKQDVTLKGLFTDVEVLAKKAGRAGNVSAGQINVIEGSLSAQLSVSNEHTLTGGKDENLVFEGDILGKISYVWFSCEKTMKVFSVLCDPRYIRWNRTFFPIHY